MSVKSYENYGEFITAELYRGPTEDMPPPFIEEEKGVLRLVIPNLNVESHFDVVGNVNTTSIDAFTCRDRGNLLQKKYPITLSKEKTEHVLKGLAHIADGKPHDPVLTQDWALRTLDKLFGVSEDLTDDWFLRLCEREVETTREYNQHN